MLAEQRRNRLLELVRLRRFASLPELAEALDVSESTVRRDVEQLEGQGMRRADPRRGALYGRFAQAAPLRCPAAARVGIENRQIAANGRAVDRRRRHHSFGWRQHHLRGGPAAGRPAAARRHQLLAGGQSCSPPTANSDLVLIGGNICPRTGVARGPYADQMLSMVRVRKTIFSVAGISEEGFFNNDLLLVETERAMMRGGRRGDRGGRQHQVRPPEPDPSLPLGSVQHLVVDDGIDDDWREKIEAAGVDLHVAAGLLRKQAPEKCRINP